jgi:sulfate adenylyltransferase
MLPEPYGGRLVNRLAGAAEVEKRLAERKDLPTIQPFIDQVYDAEKIGIGAYSPLEGFMDSGTLESVLSRDRLPNDLAWTMPILLAPSSPQDLKTLAPLRPGDEIGLADERGALFAVLRLREKFPIDPGRIAQSTYGTTDRAHPNVADIFALGPEAISGPIELLRRLDLPAGRDELTPVETRAEFSRRGWNHVAAYQCRNPPHTAHEYLQRLTLEREDVDGLFIHPVVGRLKKGDYRPDIILSAYRELVNNYYPKQRVLMSALSITMRYAGPKAALFLAIVRKNYGCSHYIVGRDQAGVGSYYDPYAAHRIFDRFDIGIQPLRYEETFFCRACGSMATPKTCAHPKEQQVATSQTRIRTALANREPLPSEIIRPEVAAILGGTDNVLT